MTAWQNKSKLREKLFMMVFEVETWTGMLKMGKHSQ